MPGKKLTIALLQPWLDFLPAQEAIKAANDANADLVEWCRPDSEHHAPIQEGSNGFSSLLPPSHRIRSFGILPFSQDVAAPELVKTLETIAQSPCLKGAIIGTRGRGKGLDDPELESLWETAQKLKQPLFLHPHYGVGTDSTKSDGIFGPMSNGHVLPLALGFPFETASVSAVCQQSRRQPDQSLPLFHRQPLA